MTRNGKIARLPRAIREQLNCRLEDGVSGALHAHAQGLGRESGRTRRGFRQLETAAVVVPRLRRVAQGRPQRRKDQERAPTHTLGYLIAAPPAPLIQANQGESSQIKRDAKSVFRKPDLACAAHYHFTANEMPLGLSILRPLKHRWQRLGEE